MPNGQSSGSGFVFTPDGRLVERLIRGGALNQPWGVAIAPAGFGPLSHTLLIGNHGDGRINAYNPVSGRFLGPLRLAGGKAFTAPNLWGLIFGDGPAPKGGNPSAGTPGTLFFTAGSFPGAHGVIGEVTLVS